MMTSLCDVTTSDNTVVDMCEKQLHDSDNMITEKGRKSYCHVRTDE